MQGNKIFTVEHLHFPGGWADDEKGAVLALLGIGTVLALQSTMLLT
jgi:hypothetical protein